MFYFKMAILGVVVLMTLVQLVSSGINFLDGMGKRKTDFVPTSLVEGVVVEVVLPTPEEAADQEGYKPGYHGKVIVEHPDSSGATLRKEMPRINSMGRTDVYDKKVGDKMSVEIPDPKSGGASTNEKTFWASLSKMLFVFASVLAVAALIFRFL